MAEPITPRPTNPTGPVAPAGCVTATSLPDVRPAAIAAHPGRPGRRPPAFLTRPAGTATLHSMRAVVLDRPGVGVQQVRAPVPGERALVRVAQAGLCGTDLKIAAGEIPVALPRVLGHEMTGWVARAGARGLLAAGHPGAGQPGRVLRAL